VERCEVDQLNTPAVEQEAAADEKRVRPLARKRCESRIDLTAASSVEDLGPQPHGASGRFHLSEHRLGHGSGWIDVRWYDGTIFPTLRILGQPTSLILRHAADMPATG
jgi:hypothetical protein